MTAGSAAIPTATVIRTRPAARAEWRSEADICVAGAGISGISAALEAARLGRRVVLVDGLPTLGGQAINSIIGTFCGLFAHGSERYRFTYGIADEILDELGASGDLFFRRGPGWTTVLYDEVALSRWVEEKIRTAGIEVILGAVIRSVVREGRRVVGLNMTHVETPLEPLAASRVGLEGKVQADNAVRFLKGEFPDAFGNSRVRAYGQPGVRQTRWIAGAYHLTARDADNLVAAGRCIDADVAALSSVRVMGPCMAMGAAAAHALDLAGEGSVHRIDLAALRYRLRDNLEATRTRPEALP